MGTDPPINAAGEQSTNEGEESSTGISFAQDIKPIFEANCNFDNCHGANPPSGLLLTSYDNFKKGGNSGPAFIPGNPEDSLIMKRIKPGGGMPQSPRDKLTEEERNKIRDWIDAGGENN